MRDYIKERSKAFAAGLGAAITIAVIKHAEKTFGFNIDDSMEIAISASVGGFVNGIIVYWSPANKPMEPKE
jgi:hypothetical protein